MTRSKYKKQFFRNDEGHFLTGDPVTFGKLKRLGRFVISATGAEKLNTVGTDYD